MSQVGMTISPDGMFSGADGGRFIWTVRIVKHHLKDGIKDQAQLFDRFQMVYGISEEEECTM